MKVRAIPFGLFALAALFFAIPQARQGPSRRVSLRLENWEAGISPETLALSAKLRGSAREITIAEGLGDGFPVSNLEQTCDFVRWKIPGLGMSAELTAAENRLHIRFETTRESKFTWPTSGRDPAMSTLIYPDGGGLAIPLDDGFWRTYAQGNPCRDTHGGLSLPFWSYQVAGGTITYLALSDLQTEVCVTDRGGRISTYAVHDFRKRDGLPPYEIEIWPGGASPISPAIEYRLRLIAKGQYLSLDQKIKENPEVEKLLGAIHAYVFGDGRTLEFLPELEHLGIDRLWLGYDQDPRRDKFLVDKRYISEARRLGYLIGPYDSFANIQDPNSADASSAIWDSELYKTGCIVNERGEIRKGYGDRGCELSSEALELAEPRKHYIENRVARHARSGINSYFLDVDAFGELFDDYSQAHPMTPTIDRLNRLRRLRYISETRKLVLGSEGGAAWSAPILDFAHGAEAVSNDTLWALQKDKKRYGGWWPPERPAIFFKPVTAGEDFRKARYDPAYRLPLYQAVFHGAVVTTDRWETPLLKFTGLGKVRTLLESLYDVPSMWSLDLRELRENRRPFISLYRFFSPIHRRIGDKPLSDFEWMMPDRMIQRTRFGDEVELTANFGREQYQAVPPMCIEARWLKDGRRQLYCPPP